VAAKQPHLDYTERGDDAEQLSGQHFSSSTPKMRQKSYAGASSTAKMAFDENILGLDAGGDSSGNVEIQ
jgi:hypothetical protein